ncbi:pyridoxal phosphate-dependent decarboxylase family protein [Rhabdothermincola salaria]|uniref:pyridoxal phosphate-dependent decarboxylase family protein n=1 Tax=Rhabdothermincola salaria TaxID=2903142 RepID=UPI001E40551D|nr:aminotransferase class V-fold PLP-dependent enzyme [Rhabdothermincola salaria]MCD9625345.1 aminotransferase class V-fold PLP-dependent enzyme [Rhabdothermincola salaria]
MTSDADRTAPVPEPSLAQYRSDFETYHRLPAQGRSRARILAELQEMHDLEQARWEEGFVSGAVYNGDADHVDFVNQAYAIHSQSNPLHTDLWPSAVKFESEIVAMTASMLGGDGIGGGPGSPDGVCGVVTSGGSESIQLAMKTYRDRGRSEQGVERPNMVLPTTAHAAFAKAAHNFGIEARWIAPTDGWVADVDAMADAVDDHTVVVVSSAPPFPHGLIDPIPELAAMALERGVGFHTDACLGGFVVPWAERLGHDVPVCDFRLPGVTSISADTHKFGYAAKGTSVVLYRDQALRHHQYFTITDWPGGLYCSPGFAGSRPGGLSAACWAAMVSMGEAGYLEATRRILATAATVTAGIRARPELRVFGDPLFVIAFTAAEGATCADGRPLDIYEVYDAMTRRGWALNGLHRPAAVHLCVTLRHTEPGVATRFLADLADAVDEVLAGPPTGTGMAPIYGMADTVPDRTLVADALVDHMDAWFRL